MALNWNVLAVDPGPFTERLAVRRGLMREARSSAPASLTADGQRGSILIVAGSATPVTKKQLQYLIANDARVCHIPVDAELLVDRKTPLRLKSIAWCSMPDSAFRRSTTRSLLLSPP
ncbi:hypothetical protein MJ699_12175 [Klebsiella pneumoniae]|nr:hypothetical protein MJ699_12175 [Klebsiella pneumoniae]